MKFFVDKMPEDKKDCPFSDERVMYLGAEIKTHKRIELRYYHCSLLKNACDLNCEKCSMLEVLK